MCGQVMVWYAWAEAAISVRTEQAWTLGVVVSASTVRAASASVVVLLLGSARSIHGAVRHQGSSRSWLGSSTRSASTAWMVRGGLGLASRLRLTGSMSSAPAWWMWARFWFGSTLTVRVSLGMARSHAQEPALGSCQGSSGAWGRPRPQRLLHASWSAASRPGSGGAVCGGGLGLDGDGLRHAWLQQAQGWCSGGLGDGRRLGLGGLRGEGGLGLSVGVGCFEIFGEVGVVLLRIV